LTRPRVVIVGAGFGGLSAARALRKAEADVLIIDRHNYHVFQPLLYQVASGLLDPSEIAHPVRSILRGHHNTDVLMADVRSIDLERQVVHCDIEVPYDFLVVAAGAVTNHFGNAEIAAHTLGLKGLNDALTLRATVLGRVERAAESTDEGERARLLTFVIAGGGPTGVEYAGALSELFLHVLPKDFPRLDLAAARVVLVEGKRRVLDTFHPRLGAMAAGVLRRRHVELTLNRLVQEADAGGITLDDGTRIDAATVIWTAGVRASPLAEQLTTLPASLGRVPVRDTLQLPGHDEVQVIGDLAALESGGELLPMLAPVAIQQGEHAARNIIALIQGGSTSPFHYHDKGTMATVGRNYAVVQLGRIRVAGFVGWLMWLFVHLTYIITFRSKVVVLINWGWNYLFYDRPVRLITEASPDRAAEAAHRAEGVNGL
jgi:NADH dehydrogenase